MDTDNYIAYYHESDFELVNNTADFGNTPKQKFTSTFIEAVKSLPGFKSLRVTTKEWMRLKYSSEMFGDYMKDYKKKSPVGDISEELLKDNFTGNIAGIDREALEGLNKTSEKPIDLDSFERGEFALISTNNPDLFKNVDELTIYPLTYSDDGRYENIETEPVILPIGGFVPLFFEEIGYSIAPTIYVSNTLMDTIYGEPIVYRLCIDVTQGYDKQALNIIKQLTDKDFEISRSSKLESQEEMREVKLSLYILGCGVALILALIGILNFINIMSVGIMVRKHELANLECVGMSRKQIRTMLLSEGLGYALITLILVFTVGNTITYGIFKLFSREAEYAIFTYPNIPVLTASIMVILVCIITPEKVYRTLYKSTLVERLREGE